MTNSSYSINERAAPWIVFIIGCAVFIANPDGFAGYDAVFVVESWKYSRQASLFLDDETLHQRYEQLSERRQAERFLDVECAPVSTGLNNLYRCR